MELVRIYCAETDNTPTPYGFLEWQSTLENPILVLISELTLNIGLGIYVNRVGEQNNDYRCSQAGRMKCIDMFYGFNHPIYREVEYSDLRNKVLYPEVVKELKKRNISFSEIHTTQNTNHQFGDFKLEERVKSMKRMAPKGSITAETWQPIARSHDKVNDVVDHAMDLLNFNDEVRSVFVNIGNEVVKWRALLRHSKYLRSNIESFVGIYGDNLNSDLLGITQKLENKCREYFRLTIHTPLENIRYDNLNDISSNIMDEIQPYIFDQET